LGLLILINKSRFLFLKSTKVLRKNRRGKKELMNPKSLEVKIFCIFVKKNNNKMATEKNELYKIVEVNMTTINKYNHYIDLYVNTQ
jgi:hypothetical protein